MPFSKGSSRPRDGTHISHVSCIGRQVLYHQCQMGSHIRWKWTGGSSALGTPAPRSSHWAQSDHWNEWWAEPMAPATLDHNPINCSLCRLGVSLHWELEATVKATRYFRPGCFLVSHLSTQGGIVVRQAGAIAAPLSHWLVPQWFTPPRKWATVNQGPVSGPAQPLFSAPKVGPSPKQVTVSEQLSTSNRGASGKEPAYQCRRQKRHGFNLWVGKIPWGKAWQAAPVFLPGESHGQRILAGYSP